MLNRRSFIGGLFAAPAVVAASSLMPIRGIVMPVRAVPTAITLANIRDLLLPGLYEITGRYYENPRWSERLRESAPA